MCGPFILGSTPVVSRYITVLLEAGHHQVNTDLWCKYLLISKNRLMIVPIYAQQKVLTIHTMK